MKKLKLAFVAALLIAVPLLGFASAASATNMRSGNNVVIKEDEIIDRTLIVSGNNIEIKGEIKGDVFCAGQNITIDAMVKGDVLCAGMNLTVGGTIEGDVRLAGQTVALSANVMHNASLAGNTITIDTAAVVGGDAQLGGGLITVNGQVMRDVHVGGNDVTLNGKIGREVTASVETLKIESSADITGNLTYYSTNRLQQASDARIAGTIMQKDPQQMQGADVLSTTLASGALFFLGVLILAMALAALFPRLVRQVALNAAKKPGTTILVGLAAFLLMPILIVGSLLTGVGLLLGLALLFFWLTVVILSGALFSYFIGQLLLGRQSQNPLLLMFVGVFVVSVLMFVPILNVIVGLAAVLFGSGMLVRELLNRTPKPVYEAAPATNSKAKTSKQQ